MLIIFIQYFLSSIFLMDDLDLILIKKKVYQPSHLIPKYMA